MSQEGKFLLYKVTFPNAKIYIGYTSFSLTKRKQKHYEHAKHEKKHRTPIMNAIKKYSPLEQWEIIKEFTSLNEVHSAEIAFIKMTDSTNPNIGYNISAGGDGVKHTALTKAKISKASIIVNKLRFSNPINRKKQSLKLKEYWSKNDNKAKASLRRGTKPFYALNVKTGAIIGKWTSQAQCARDLHISACFISNVLAGRRIGKIKYTFKYEV
jgi:group I intron endonuclease